jgi:hypothetical protein
MAAPAERLPAGTRARMTVSSKLPLRRRRFKRQGLVDGGLLRQAAAGQTTDVDPLQSDRRQSVNLHMAIRWRIMSVIRLTRVIRADAADLLAANSASQDYHLPWVTSFTDQTGFDNWFARGLTGPQRWPRCA